MTLVFAALFTLFLAMVWWFFIIAKIHAYKFKNFSIHIEKVTNILFVVLIILSLLGYILIFSYTSLSTKTVDMTSSSYEEEWY